MIRRLKSTGVYRLDQTTAAEKKFRVFADYFGQLEDRIERITNDCFTDTMTAAGLKRCKELYRLSDKLSRTNLKTIVQRRTALTNRDFTRAGILRCMAAGGFEAELSEDFAARTVTVSVKKDLGAFGTREEKEAFLRGCLPCHVKGIFVF